MGMGEPPDGTTIITYDEHIIIINNQRNTHRREYLAPVTLSSSVTTIPIPSIRPAPPASSSTCVCNAMHVCAVSSLGVGRSHPSTHPSV